MRTFLNRKKNSIVGIKAECTNQYEILFMSHWLKNKYGQDAIQEWIKIMKLLSGCKLMVMFKGEISDVYKKRLMMKGIEFRDNVAYPTKQPTPQINAELEQNNYDSASYTCFEYQIHTS